MRHIGLGHLAISDEGKQFVNDCLDNNRLSYGKYTKAFEDEFATEHAVSHAVFCNSGTSALQIALATLKEKYEYQDGDEVLVPAMTFIATSNIVIQNGLKPVFVDVDPFTFNIDPNEIEDKITSRTRCIIPVHLFGLPCDMRRIMRIAHRNGLQVIEDSCETMFAEVHGIPVGGWGDIGCFSNYVAHHIVGGVGGIVTTNWLDYAEMCRSYLQHGRDTAYLSIDDDDKINESIMTRRYRFARVGYSYRATELEAAIALSELHRAAENIATRRDNAAYLTHLLAGTQKLQLPSVPKGFEHSFMMYPMVLDVSIDRDAFLMKLEKSGIETRYMFPLLSQPIYRKLFPGMEDKYPIAKYLTEHGFFIGMHQGMTWDDMGYIAQEIKCGIQS